MRFSAYRKDWVKSLGLHFILLICLALSFNWTSKPIAAPAKSEPAPVQANAVSAAEIQKQLNTIEREHQQRHQKEIKKKQEMQQMIEQADMAKKIRAVEQQRLQRLQEEQNAAIQKQKSELAEQQKALEALKQKSLAEKKNLEQIEQKQAEAKKQASTAQVAEKKSQDSPKPSPTEVKKTAATETTDNKSAENKTEDVTPALTPAQLSEIDRYSALIQSAIEQQWIVPDAAMAKKTACQLSIHLASGGIVVDVKLVKSSGDAALDRSAVAAVFKASPLPVPEDTSLFDSSFRDFNLTVHPEGYLNA